MKKWLNRPLIVLLQHRVLGKGHQFGRLGKLSALIRPSLGNNKAGSRAHVIDDADHGEENGKYAKYQQCAIKLP